MCGRMTQQTSPEEVARIFDAEVRDSESGEFQPSWNVAPTDPLTVVLQREDGRSVERPRWGLIPSWAKQAKDGARQKADQKCSQKCTHGFSFRWLLEFTEPSGSAARPS